jgi:hypothetical protein
MSKPLTSVNMVIRVVFLVLLGLLILGGLGGFVILIYLPVLGWIIWRLMDRTAELEAKVAALEGHPIVKKENQ